MTTTFDASIGLTTALIPDGAPVPAGAAARVRHAVEALPGAGLIDVEDCFAAPPALPWLTLFKPGSAHPRSGAGWDDIAEVIEATVRRTLA